jgi:hypothetical protein
VSNAVADPLLQLMIEEAKQRSSFPWSQNARCFILVLLLQP